MVSMCGIEIYNLFKLINDKCEYMCKLKLNLEIPKTCIYFPVTILALPMLQSTEEVLFQSYTDAMASGPDCNSVVTVPNNYHELSQFLSKEHWLELIENKNIDALQLLGLPAHQALAYAILPHSCIHLYHPGQDAQKRTTFCLSFARNSSAVSIVIFQQFKLIITEIL